MLAWEHEVVRKRERYLSRKGEDCGNRIMVTLKMAFREMYHLL